MAQDISFAVRNNNGDAVRVGVWRFEGNGGGPKVHLQAGVHADEIAGMLVLHLLMQRLHIAEAEGRLKGSVTVVPQANPLGIGQFRHGRILGRFHDATGHNFNRSFDQSTAMARPSTPVQAWQKSLVQLAATADVMLDLHTDDEALPYLYVHRSFWPRGRELAAAMKMEVAIIWDDGGDGSFEETIIAPWLRDGVTDQHLAATLELRGQGDVSDRFAEQDAAGLYAWLCACGVIDEPLSPGDWPVEAIEMSHMETILAPQPGVLIFEKELGDFVEEGQRFARILGRPGDPSSAVLLFAEQAGRMVTRYRDRLVQQGMVVAKFTGTRVSCNWSGGLLDPN
ncbi:aminoalkylphosphonate N-acetyltransferase [Pseudomonas sp. FW306-02-F02-AA]|uniref:Succinylglutamate desuccinylase n=1 Tax=Pseudomonas fluorescens TaxID=294 RepID=A0A0N9X278_PSEFL|nr:MULTISPECIES: succinylglutamate desuccinylase/aspartoacylase family protein [Pseudomonas]ALI04735.1 succinylglutamate desuccinylase [Pseudomonas fluorescens]PMZ05455.1 aminoalkylphosphonate N-acetyltransferase [Pseudomonas sp. FW306-02-F02-AB]PMZ11025.1 aminoalkylphosphonate N-acetyltransferase [Pseudomonas sp. FW306-02-H06C]PMZ16980.1 aminoalkylphosphonate N-acetyltransferase [Pseudomonas sp. FW306-02-F02-AA]PMZ23225.1 aminoalkylphosphonate N-acetyltransferase [Pseudomonas sp. FW306-02-F08